MQEFTNKTTEKMKKKDERLELWCECCGEKWDRWDIDLVEPTDDFLLPSDDFNFACPVCIANHSFIPKQTEHAKEFRSRNERLRNVIAPVVVH